jgi:hypothetical protein
LLSDDPSWVETRGEAGHWGPAPAGLTAAA